jgi:hypothetical protein
MLTSSVVFSATLQSRHLPRVGKAIIRWSVSLIRHRLGNASVVPPSLLKEGRLQCCFTVVILEGALATEESPRTRGQAAVTSANAARNPRGSFACAQG